ncbi:LysR family transcriptional regulator [Vibrio atypicus]|jgi:DNA-binding transcriptional LysR family regulator|uniref:LysR family transcriptional regulator n=1 Tax=Vibrio atypicus TaxID=558271 RepID=UPI001358E47B|nr:LysR family transcriptional regulator [Vibrio atypicus]
MFSYEHLIAFCTTYEQQGYSAAAKKLNKDRTTIRDQVKAIEDLYDVTLFEIVGKKACPTNAAKHIYQRSKVIISNTEKLNASFGNIYRQDLLHINVYHDISLPLNLALKIEHALAQHYPELTIHWLHRNREEAFDCLESDPNSIALMQHRNMQSAEKNIAYYSLGYGKLGVYSGKRSKLRHLVNLSTEDLKLEKQYISENHFNTLPELYAISPQYHLVSNNDLLLELVKHDGWAIMSTELSTPLVRSGDLHQLNIGEVANQFTFGLTLYYSLSLENEPALTLIKKITKEHFSTFD